MSGPSHTSPVLLAQAYLLHLQETKEEHEQKTNTCARILSVLQGQLEHKENKLRGGVPATEKEKSYKVIDLAGDDEEDVSDAEASEYESANENEDDLPSPERVYGDVRYTNGASEDPESEEESEEARRNSKAWRDELRQIQRGNAPPCPDESHPNWCVHARDLRYHSNYTILSDSEDEGEDEDDSDEDAMSTENDTAEPAGNEDESMSNTTLPSKNAHQATVEDDYEDEIMDDTKPPSDGDIAGSRARDNQPTFGTDSASNNNQNDSLEPCSTSANATPDEPVKLTDAEIAELEEGIADMRERITAYANELAVLKPLRTRLNAILVPKIVEMTKKLSTAKGLAQFTEMGFSFALGVFGEYTKEVDRLCQEIRDSVAGEAEESEEASEQASEVASEETGEEPGEEAGEEIEQPQGVVFSIPIIGGKREREEGESEETAAKRARLEDSA